QEGGATRRAPADGSQLRPKESRQAACGRVRRSEAKVPEGVDQCGPRRTPREANGSRCGVIEEKRCTVCGALKAISEFYCFPVGSCRRRSACKEGCRTRARAQYHEIGRAHGRTTG